MADELDYNIPVSEFEPYQRYYIHFRTNTLGERYEPPYPYSVTRFFYKDDFDNE